MSEVSCRGLALIYFQFNILPILRHVIQIRAPMSFPNDIDGDVMRTLAENHFNFDEQVEIEFFIEFKHWPLNHDEKTAIQKLYSHCDFIDPEQDDIENGEQFGYVAFSVTHKVEHEFIVNMQKTVSSEMEKFGGVCDSWAVGVGEHEHDDEHHHH